ncbi:Unknown protein sequence [Pseudomonas syringae pv. maculicola]|nr:Unknown protein sequence [Pseudomonas syringae pv. maculicola]
MSALEMMFCTIVASNVASTLTQRRQGRTRSSTPAQRAAAVF